MTREDAVTRAASRAVDRRGRRAMLLSLSVVAVGVGVALTALFIGRAQQADAIAVLESRVDASTAAAQQLADQVRSLGGVPAVQPPSPERGEQGVGIASIVPGECALTVRLTDGRESTAGNLCRPGRSVTATTTDGCFVAVGFSDSTSLRVGPFCGPPGASGTPGRDGQDGADGQDGQSPPCLSEESQCRGADGRDGVDGASPRGWVTTRADGSEETCTRDESSSDAAPTYSCETTSPPTLIPRGR